MNTDRPTLTPDGVAYARFILEATPWGGVAASNAIMLRAQMLACNLDNWDQACKECDDCQQYTQELRDEDARRLRHLFPFIRCLDPVMADEMAMQFPFLWDLRDAKD